MQVSHEDFDIKCELEKKSDIDKHILITVQLFQLNLSCQAIGLLNKLSENWFNYFLSKKEKKKFPTYV